MVLDIVLLTKTLVVAVDTAVTVLMIIGTGLRVTVVLNVLVVVE